MHILKRKTLSDFCDIYPDSKGGLRTFLKIIIGGSFTNLNKIQALCNKSSILKDNRMVFRVKSYRLVVKFRFEAKLALVKYIGTHDEYDKIDANTVEF